MRRQCHAKLLRKLMRKCILKIFCTYYFLSMIYTPNKYNLFGQNQKSDPKIITKKGVYLFKNKWSYIDYEKIHPNTSILENLKELLRAMQDNDNLQTFLEHVALATSIDQEWEGAKVNLMTMHAAKGLEFDLSLIHI